MKWKQIVAREKTKFKMKLRRRKQKVKWGKRREEQNMRLEINYNIKFSDNMHKLEGQEMNVKKLCKKENIANPEDCGGICLGSI